MTNLRDRIHQLLAEALIPAELTPDEHAQKLTQVEAAAVDLARLCDLQGLPDAEQRRQLRSLSSDRSLKTMRAELRDLTKLTAKLADRLGGLNQPEIVALGEHGIDEKFRSAELIEGLKRLAKAAEEAGFSLGRWLSDDWPANALNEWDRKIGDRVLSEWRPQHRARNERANGISDLLIWHAELISGGDAGQPVHTKKKPRAHGIAGLEALCREIFKLADLEADPKAQLAAAVRRRSERREIAKLGARDAAARDDAPNSA